MAGARQGAGRGQAIPIPIAILIRVLAATAGAYAASHALAAALARILPLPRSEAVILSSMLGIVAIVGFAIWAFAERSLLRLGIGLALVMAVGTIIAKGHLP